MTAERLDIGELRAFVESASADELRDAIIAAATDEAKLRAFVSLAESPLPESPKVQRALDEAYLSDEVLVRAIFRMAASEAQQSDGLLVAKTTVPREMYKMERERARSAESRRALVLQDLSRKGARMDPMDVEATRFDKLSRIFEEEAEVLERQSVSQEKARNRQGHRGPPRRLIDVVLAQRSRLRDPEQLFSALRAQSEWRQDGDVIEVEEVGDGRWRIIPPNGKATEVGSDTLSKYFRQALRT